MKPRTLMIAAALLAMGTLVGAVSQPGNAQDAARAYGGGAGEWQAAGSYHTTEGGEVWMINTRTGAARNCFWQRRHESAPLTLQCRDTN